MKHEEAIAMLAAEKYVLGEMKAEERESFEEHYFTCPDCARDVEELDLIQRGTRTVGASLPERPLAWTERLAMWWARPQMGMAAATALVALVAYNGYQATRPVAVAEEAVALNSQMLRPETRGEVPVLEVLGKKVLVEVDLPGASGELTWMLRGAGDKEVASGKAMAPEPGQTLKLLLPAASLEGSSQFLLEFRGADSYRFRFATRKN
jgi:hypothetical protein